MTNRGAEAAVDALRVVEAADAEFFRPVPDPAALLAMLRPLAAPESPGTVR